MAEEYEEMLGRSNLASLLAIQTGAILLSILQRAIVSDRANAMYENKRNDKYELEILVLAVCLNLLARFLRRLSFNSILTKTSFAMHLTSRSLRSCCTSRSSAPA